MQQYNQNK